MDDGFEAPADVRVVERSPGHPRAVEGPVGVQDLGSEFVNQPDQSGGAGLDGSAGQVVGVQVHGPTGSEEIGDGVLACPHAPRQRNQQHHPDATAAEG